MNFYNNNYIWYVSFEKYQIATINDILQSIFIIHNSIYKYKWKTAVYVSMCNIIIHMAYRQCVMYTWIPKPHAIAQTPLDTHTQTGNYKIRLLSYGIHPPSPETKQILIIKDYMSAVFYLYSITWEKRKKHYLPVKSLE